MTLYELLVISKYYQKIWIYVDNDYDQNMLVYKGTVQGARGDVENTWDHMMDKVELLDWATGTLLVYIADEHQKERLEEQYSDIVTSRWGKEKNKRPWRYSIEIEEELKAEASK